MDVRRQRGLAVSGEGGHGVGGVEPDGPAAVGESLPDLDAEVGARVQGRPLADPATGLDQRFPPSGLVERLEQQHLDHSARRLLQV